MHFRVELFPKISCLQKNIIRCAQFLLRFPINYSQLIDKCNLCKIMFDRIQLSLNFYDLPMVAQENLYVRQNRIGRNSTACTGFFV